MDSAADRPPFNMHAAELDEFYDEFISSLEPADRPDGERSTGR